MRRASQFPRAPGWRQFCFWLAFLLVALGAAAAERPEIKRMRRVTVQSEAIKCIGYHRKTRTLEVQFHSGTIYRYGDVSPVVYQQFLKAESKGRYFREHVRRSYGYWKVEPK